MIFWANFSCTVYRGSVLKFNTGISKIYCLVLIDKQRSLDWLCTVIKHAGSGQSTKEVQAETRSGVFLPTSLFVL